MRIDYFDTMQHARKKYAQLMEPICQAHSLTRNELDVLLFLHNNPEYDRAADIVAHRGMVKSHVSLSVSELEKKGLLVRAGDPGDRRMIHLKLTAPAREIAEAGRAAQHRFFTRIFQGLTREDIDRWRGIMSTVTQNILSME